MSNIKAKIIQDTDPESPREWCNIGTMACWHGRYNLGDEQPKCDPEDYIAELPEGSVILPLYLYDHSGITMSTSGFPCAWDSGQVGIIYVTPERIRKEYGDDSSESREKAESCLKSEVKVYDWYITGNVWGFQIEKVTPCDSCGHPDVEVIDSCWGFLGDDEENVLNAMKDHVEDEHHAALDEAWENRFD